MEINNYDLLERLVFCKKSLGLVHLEPQSALLKSAPYGELDLHPGKTNSLPPKNGRPAYFQGPGLFSGAFAASFTEGKF